MCLHSYSALSNGSSLQCLHWLICFVHAYNYFQPQHRSTSHVLSVVELIIKARPVTVCLIARVFLFCPCLCLPSRRLLQPTELPLCRSVYNCIFKIFSPLHTPHLTLALIGRLHCNTVTHSRIANSCVQVAKTSNLPLAPHFLPSLLPRFSPRSSRSSRASDAPLRSSSDLASRVTTLPANCCSRCPSAPSLP